MYDLTIFNSPEFGEIRTVTVNHEPWFVAIDAAKALGYSNPYEAIKKNVSEVDTSTMGVIDSLGREQPTKIINESGLYDLVFESRLESAKKFRRWVTSEVLPSLRRTGIYTMPELRVLENKAALLDRLSGGYENKNFRDSAKALDITQSQLIGWLKESKMIYKNDYGDTIPTPEYISTGFFLVIPYHTPGGFTGNRTLITPTGLTAFSNMLDAAGLNKSNMKKHGGRKGGNPNWR